jgi:tRNA (guanosine-2'-O-)-methyltransferase
MIEVLEARLGSVVVVAEAVRRRHNVSAILRSADALGLHEVHLVTRTFKASAGACRGAERWLRVLLDADTPTCIEGLRQRGFTIWAADLDSSCTLPEAVPVEGPVALLFGSEMAGVSPEARSLCDGIVGLPMRGFVESLNVSVAAALILRSVSERRRARVGADLDEIEKERILEAWIEREHRYIAAASRRATGSPT